MFPACVNNLCRKTRLLKKWLLRRIRPSQGKGASRLWLWINRTSLRSTAMLHKSTEMPLSIHWHIPALWDDMTRWNSRLSYLCFAISSTTIDLAGCLRAALADWTHFGWRAADGAPAQWLIYVCGSSGVRDKHGRKTQSSPQWPSRKTNKEGTINGSLWCCDIFFKNHRILQTRQDHKYNAGRRLLPGFLL